MTFNAKIRFFNGFFGNSGLQHTFLKRQHSRDMVAPSGVCKYIVPIVSCWTDELRFLRSGPSNMHRCHAFPFALAGLFLFLFSDTISLTVINTRTTHIKLNWLSLFGVQATKSRLVSVTCELSDKAQSHRVPLDCAVHIQRHQDCTADKDLMSCNKRFRP